MDYIQKYYNLNGDRLVKAFNKRNFEAYYFETKEEALKKVIDLVPEKSIVAWGGSETLKIAGIRDYFYKNGNYTILDRDNAETLEEKDKIGHDSLNSDFYLMSANAMSLDGKLVNIDGTGNRLAALIYGPKNVIVVVGMNKLEPNEESALVRAKHYAAPVNMMRFDLETPCKITGACNFCTSLNCICCHTNVTRFSREKGRIKIIVVGESMGF